jgi:hypothetical protein
MTMARPATSGRTRVRNMVGPPLILIGKEAVRDEGASPARVSLVFSYRWAGINGLRLTFPVR